MQGAPATTRDPVRFSTGTVLNGRYEIIKPVGMGGYAIVYEAFDLQIERRVAIKTLHNNLAVQHDPVERFKREAKAAGRIKHPNAVTVYDTAFIEDTEQPFIVMEYLEGVNLYDELARFGPMSPLRALPLLCQALAALSEAHALGMVHRDLKPANLFLVAPRTTDEEIRVLDFGGALMDEWSLKLTQEGNLFGTVQYMPPEYIREEIVTPALDVYQMGLILLETLSGRAVIQGEPQLAHVKHLNQALPIPNRLLDSPLRSIILRSLSEDLDERYRDADEMLEALGAIAPTSVPPLREGAILTTLLYDVLRGSGPSQELPRVGPRANAATEELTPSQVIDPNAPDPIEAQETSLYTPNDIDLESDAIALPSLESGQTREVTHSQIEASIRSPFARLAAEGHPLPPPPAGPSALFHVDEPPPSVLASVHPAATVSGVVVLFVLLYVGIGVLAQDDFLNVRGSSYATAPTTNALNTSPPPERRQPPRVLRASLDPEEQEPEPVAIDDDELKDMKLIEVVTEPAGIPLYQKTDRGEVPLEDPVMFAFPSGARPVTIIARQEGFLDQTIEVSADSPHNITIALARDEATPQWRRRLIQKRLRERAQANEKRTGSDWIAD